MELLQRGVDQTVIALWLGHTSVETTQVYIHADLRIKEKALITHHATRNKPGPISSGRQAARLPRSALIMTNTAWPEGCGSAGNSGHAA